MMNHTYRAHTEDRGHDADRSPLETPHPVPHVGGESGLRGPTRKASHIPSRGSEAPDGNQATEGTLVVASPLVESRRRWMLRLQEDLAICEVTERKALARAMMKLKPDVLV